MAPRTGESPAIQNLTVKISNSLFERGGERGRAQQTEEFNWHFFNSETKGM